MRLRRDVSLREVMCFPGGETIWKLFALQKAIFIMRDVEDVVLYKKR